MSQPLEDDHEVRIGSLERQIAELRQRLAVVGNDAGAARVLGAGADREVAELRAELRADTRVLTALRETQVEQGLEMRRGFASVDRRFVAMESEMNERFAAVQSEMREIGERVSGLESEMREGFAVLGVGMAQITALLTGIADTD